MNPTTASAITDALCVSARHLWFAMMLARHGTYANAQEMQVAAREVADAIAATMNLPTVADLLFTELSGIVDVLVLGCATDPTSPVH